MKIRYNVYLILVVIQVNVTPKEKKAVESAKKGYEDEYCLLLAPFQPVTKIKLDCQVNKSVECNLKISNNNKYPIKVIIFLSFCFDNKL